MSLGAFYTELEARELELEEARAKLRPNGETDPVELEHYRQVSADFAEWRRAIRVLGGRPTTEMAPVGVGALDPTVTVEEN